MKTVVITGSTRGIGFGLADSFLSLDCAVVISGRNWPSVDKAVNQLATRHTAERVYGHPCDVTNYDQIQLLWDAACNHFGQVDIWINNAGTAHPQMPLWEHTPEELKAVIETNLLGAVYGTKVAYSSMLKQGHGALYNMEGLGSTGRRVKGLALYGCTKAAVRYLNQSLAREAEGSPVIVGALRPGMVMTDLISTQYIHNPQEWERAKRIFNILADRVETVTPWLAAKVLANKQNGMVISWTAGGKVFGRFLISPFHKRHVVD